MTDNTLAGFYKNKKVFITGHTGFKGSWLSIWLNQLGAEVSGYSLSPVTSPSNFIITRLEDRINSCIADIRDYKSFEREINDSSPEMVFHLAAQPIVRESYKDPLNTYTTNLIGLVNLLEIIRKSASVKAVLIITSDKCYLNKEWIWGYKETDELGGFDPYSSSKACAEIISSSYRNSFLRERNIHLATARSGNVIGGGDWSSDRIIPDCIRGITSGSGIHIRNPHSTRPWQHVLEPLRGYLLLMQKLYEGNDEKLADSWNFGPGQFEQLNVLEIVKYITNSWKGKYFISNSNGEPHETGTLNLDCSKSYYKLKWQPVLKMKETLDYTIDWYRSYYDENKNPYNLCINQIDDYSKILKSRLSL